ALAIDGRTLSGGPGGANDHSGSYAATLQIASYTGATMLVDTLATTIVVVDRSQSAFGAGWWLAGLERLYFPTDGTVTWVGGDGSIRTYTKDPAHTTVYRAPNLTRLDSLVKDASGQFIRYLPNRLHVRFNSAGQHIATITRLGDSTVFAYNASGQLATITVAPVSAAKTYSLFYDASGRLDSVSAPLGGSNGATRRVTKLSPVGSTRQVASVTLADGSIIHLAYDAAHVGRLITSTDPRGTTTTFAYDSAGKLATATIGMKGVTADLATRITTSASQGIRGTVAVDTAVVATRIDGPRTDVGDTTVIRVTPFGAPRRITDALGHITRLDHNSAAFPALVTHEHRLDAAASLATYDAKAHLVAETDSTTYADDAVGTRTYATTLYKWDAIWDEVTVIAPPLHDSSVMTYDAATGNRLTQRDVVGDTVHYGYNSTGRLVSVRPATHAPADSLTYDALGNVASTITPKGYVSRSFRDATGRDTLVTTPIDSQKTLVTSSRTVYDLADRPTLTQAFGPAVSYLKSAGVSASTAPETLTVATVYDSAGLVRRVTRTAAPNLANLSPLVTRTGYDPAGRKVADTATDGAVDTYAYDASGHVVEHVSRDLLTESWTYDALGELVERSMEGGTYPGLTFNPLFVAWAPNDFAKQHTDQATFTYDSAGHMLSADNPTAEIRRTYMPNGALLTDSLRISTWAYGDFSRHVFALAHGYDLDGRRRVTQGLGGDSADYDLAGRLSGIEDQTHKWFRYHYDPLGRPDTTTFANGARVIDTYDADDQVTRRQELSPTNAVLHDDALSYDARGKVLRGVDTVETDYEGYSALGTLWWSARTNIQLGPFAENKEQFIADAMGNVVHRDVTRSGSGGAPDHDTTASAYDVATGRMAHQVSVGSVDTTLYTPAGERWLESGAPKVGQGSTTSFNYYSADGLLMAVDHRSCTTTYGSCIPQGPFEQPTTLTGAFEDYRYDALGRRVQVRTRMDNVCEGTACVSSLMWVVWDGNQIAAEIRGPGGDGLSPDSLEAAKGDGAMYGTVEYVNGPTVDEPLEIQGIVVYRTWRGLIDGGDCMTGTCGSTGTIDYPGLTYEAYLDAIPSTQSAPLSWHGSLFAQGLDDGGLMYRRNRYYDPATGQFTQEDPTGLAGGMNLYGFGAGDPINNDDPFGTACPPGRAIAICVLVSVMRSLNPGDPPFPTTKPRIESRSTTAPNPKPDLSYAKENGAGEMKELVEDGKKASNRLMGTDPEDPSIIRKILTAGVERDGAMVKLPLGLSRALGGAVSLFIMHALSPPTLGGNPPCSNAGGPAWQCPSQ
ncbi:MAG: RHS repeat-associated core domain-containing protein, partial [Gemmatimonadaceae bacterium]